MLVTEIASAALHLHSPVSAGLRGLLCLNLPSTRLSLLSNFASIRQTICIKQLLLNSVPEVQELFNAVIMCVSTPETLQDMKSLQDRRALTQSCTWHLKQNLLQKATKTQQRQHSSSVAWLCHRSLKQKRTCNIGIFGSCSRTYCLLNVVFKNELKMSAVFRVKARDLKHTCCLLKYQRPKLLSIMRAKNWNNSRNTSMRVLSSPKSLTGNMH